MRQAIFPRAMHSPDRRYRFTEEVLMQITWAFISMKSVYVTKTILADLKFYNFIGEKKLVSLSPLEQMMLSHCHLYL